MSYNPIERKLAQLLSSFPGVKSKIKYSYQWFNYWLHKPQNSFESEYSIHELGEEDQESFFGYYDKSPLNSSGEYALFQQTKHPTKLKPAADQPIEVVLFHWPTQKVIQKWETKAYNWQQGAKPMWLDELHFSFNYFDLKKQTYGAQIIHVNETNIAQVVKTPLYDASAQTGLSLSFERLNEIMPDYGYRNLKPKAEFDYTKEGIIKVDLENCESELLISIQQIMDLHPKKNMENATHWFNHIQLSPNGQHFIFLHRWIQNGRKYDALILSDIEGKKIRCLADDDMVSHCFWRNDRQIISYMRDVRRGDQYYQIDIEKGEKTIVGKEEWKSFGDGHPHTFGKYLIFDTYPNRSRMKELFLFDFETQKLKQLGAFLEPLKYHGETRCDLHPRFSKDGKKVFFDSVHKGKRRLCYIDLEEVE
jgi:hypothetical protein